LTATRTLPGRGSNGLGAKSLGFRRDIQGLRALAVLSVLGYHARLPGVSGGYVGVDVFFVISGFLITGHLLRQAGERRGIDFLHFYSRRIRRILPASLAVLVLSLAAAWVWIPPLIRSAVLRDGFYTALFVPNIHFSRVNIDYLADPNPSLFQHYWSLGVEEQFYLVWPVLMALAAIVTKRSRRGLSLVLLSVLVVSFTLCLWLTERSQPDAFFLMPTRAWEFAAGGLVALLVTSYEWRLPGVVRSLGWWLGLCGLVLSIVGLDDATSFPGTAAALPVASTAILIACGAGGDRAGRFLEAAPLQFVGAISFSLYLVHWPLLTIPQMLYDERRILPLPISVGLAALSIPLAWILYRYVETPWRHPGHRPNRSRDIVVAGAVAAVVAGVSVAGVRVLAATDFHTNLPAPETVISQQPRGTGYVPRNLTPALRKAKSDNPTVYATGCHLKAAEFRPVGCTSGPLAAQTSVVLFGDSHAAQWHPAFEVLANRGNLRLTSHTMSSCPPYAVPDSNPNCMLWREEVISSVESDPPDIVVLAGFAHGGPTSVHPTVWTRGIRSTVERMSDVTDVVVLSDPPNFRITPATCLSDHLEDASSCDRPRDAATDPRFVAAERAAATESGGSYVDLTDYFCTRVCFAIQGNTLVYRDSHHLSASFSAAIADVLADAIGQSTDQTIDYGVP
jgi:peptidoglycan/LPS O-acetylase OafA/YrhL